MDKLQSELNKIDELLSSLCIKDPNNEDPITNILKNDANVQRFKIVNQIKKIKSSGQSSSYKEEKKSSLEDEQIRLAKLISLRENDPYSDLRLTDEEVKHLLKNNKLRDDEQPSTSGVPPRRTNVQPHPDSKDVDFNFWFKRMTNDERQNICTKHKLNNIEKGRTVSFRRELMTKTEPNLEDLYNNHRDWFKNVKGDGKCFYRCLSWELCGTEDEHDKIRRLIIVNMRNNPIWYMNGRMKYDEYIEVKNEEMKDLMLAHPEFEDYYMDNWAMHGEIIGACELFNINIYIWALIVGYDDNSKFYGWQCFPSIHGECDENKPSIYIWNQDAIHYQVVLRIS